MSEIEQGMIMIIEGKNYLTEKEICKNYDVSLAWIRKLRLSSKGIPYYKLNGRVFYEESEVAKWFKENMVAM